MPINNLDYAERASSSKITVTEEVAAASTSSVPIEVPPDVEKRSGYELTAARSAGPEKSEPPSPYVRRKSWTPVTLIGVASVSVAIFIAWELWPSGNSAKPSDSTGQHALAGTATSPLTVKAITPLDPDPNPDASFVLPGKQAFSQPQLTSIRSQELHENESFQKWLQSKNGTLITSQTRFNVTVQSNSKSEVVVTDIRIVKNCHAPTGTLFHVPTQGGGPIPTVKLYFSLRDRDPHAKDADTDKPYFAQNTISLLPGESSTFNMDVQFLPDMQCDFTFKIEVATPEKSELSVDNNGRPFRLYDLGDFKGYQTLYATGGPKNVTPFNPVNPASYNGLGSPSVYSNSTAIPAPPKP